MIRMADNLYGCHVETNLCLKHGRCIITESFRDQIVPRLFKHRLMRWLGLPHFVFRSFAESARNLSLSTLVVLAVGNFATPKHLRLITKLHC